MKKMYIFIVILTALILVGSIGWYYYNKTKPNNISINYNLQPLTKEELSVGWYFGSERDRRPGTPPDWVHVLEGSRSAKWQKP